MIRTYRKADYSELLRLRCLLFPEHSEQELREELTAFFYQPGQNRFINYRAWTSFVYEREQGGLGGFIDVGMTCPADYAGRLPHFAGTPYYREIEERLAAGLPIPVVESWYVDEDLRGRGLGLQLMQRAQDWVKEQGCPFILSDTDDWREVSKKAHRSFGYDNYHVAKDGCHYFYKRIG